VLCIAFTNVNPGNNGGTEVMQDGPHPYFLYDVIIFFGMKGFEAQGIFEIPERIFLVPPHMVQPLKILKIKFLFWKICDDVPEASG